MAKAEDLPGYMQPIVDGKFILYRLGQPTLDAPSVPVVHQLLKSIGHSTMALAEVVGPYLNSPDDGDRPLQGETQRLHQPPVARGPDGFGTASMRRASCHQSANFDAAGMPGNPHWHLAPREMAWQGKMPGEICVQIKDPARNGGRSLQEILTHMATDTLVGWAWAPGFGCKPAPGTQQELGALIEAWIKTGAVCPT